MLRLHVFLCFAAVTLSLCAAEKSALDFVPPFQVIADLIVDKNFFLLRELSAEEKASGRVDLDDPFGEKLKIRQLSRVKNIGGKPSSGVNPSVGIASLLPPPKIPTFSKSTFSTSSGGRASTGTTARQNTTTSGDRFSTRPATFVRPLTAQTSPPQSPSPQLNRATTRNPNLSGSTRINQSSSVSSSSGSTLAQRRPSAKPSLRPSALRPSGPVRKVTRIVRKRIRAPSKIASPVSTQSTESPSTPATPVQIRTSAATSGRPFVTPTFVSTTRPVITFPSARQQSSRGQSAKSGQTATKLAVKNNRILPQNIENTITAAVAGSVRDNIVQIPDRVANTNTVQLSSRKNTVPNRALLVDSERDQTGEISNLLRNLPGGYETVVKDMSKSVFSCDGRPYGYYADMAANCQVFHICTPVVYPDGYQRNLQHSFFCNNGTLFDQKTLSCQKTEMASMPCDKSQDYYSAVEYFQKFSIFDRFREQHEREQKQQQRVSRLETLDDVEDLEASLNA